MAKFFNYFPKTLYSANNKTGGLDTVTNIITIDDFMFSKRAVNGSEIIFRNTGGILPSPLTIGTKYYLLEVDTNMYKLCLTPEDVILDVTVNLTTVGTGINTIVFKNVVEDPEDQIIHLTGTFGSMELNTYSLEGILYNTKGLSGSLKMSYVNQYLACKELGIMNDYYEFFLLIFKQKFAEGLGRQKMTVKLDGLPVDITADDLLGLQQDLSQQVKEYTESKTRWWLFA